ncbi:unnamed protein product [Clonostachys rhizophaga]|uniref:Uncharacterized protein n=1 Tax=Clonostachys rhizophaga TaxID=160324 RepID=A0A9N9YER4_9HYPO|nr:unnamed protein product [Clonostachys rhizophaga]
MYTLTTTDEHLFGSDVYVLDLLRTPSGRLVSISSDQKLSLLNPASLSKGPISSFQTDHGNLTTMRLFGDNVVCTAGENGNVGVWDLRAGAQVVQFATSEAPLASLACSPETQTIAVGTELHNHEASILLWDVRSAPVQKAAYHDLHSDDITTLTYHPSNPNVLLSGSTDGLVSVHDTSIADEDELTVQTLNLNASIHRAGFLGPSLVYALSHDERFAIYDISEAQGSGDAIRDFGDLRGYAECQYVADIVPKNDGSGAIVGAGAQDKQTFELMFLTNYQGSWEVNRANSVGLPGAHGEEIVRAYCFFDESQMVFTGGEDGKVKAWRPGN